jgi:hypothetical protein
MCRGSLFFSHPFSGKGPRRLVGEENPIMPTPVIVFKVALSGQKSIWRKIAIKDSQTLDDLHEVIFDAFDRDDEHLYSFYFPRPGAKLNLRKIRESREFTHPAACEDAGPFGSDAENAAKTKLSSLHLKPKQNFAYLFDFGDEWWHEITVEETGQESEKGRKYPCVVDQKGKSPPQYPDCDDDDEDDYDDEE